METINTGLRTLRGGSIKLTFDVAKLKQVQESLATIDKICLPKSRIKHLQLLDEYESATIEGAATTVSKILTHGVQTKSDKMVVQSLAGLQYLLQQELNVNTLIQAWKIIVEGCCENQSAGVDGFRTGPVYVLGHNGNILHVPADPEDVPEFISKLLSYSTGNNILDAILYGFYLVYVHPFADGNGRTSRALMQYFIGLHGLPLSKVLNLHRRNYFRALYLCESTCGVDVDVAPFIGFMFDAILYSCSLFTLYSKELSTEESDFLVKIDKAGRGHIGIKKAIQLFDCDEHEAIGFLNNLVDTGYLEMDKNTQTYHLIWR